MHFSLTIGLFVIKMEILNRHIGSFPEPSSVERTSTKETEGNGAVSEMVPTAVEGEGVKSSEDMCYVPCSTHPNRPKLFSRKTEIFSLSVNYFLFRK
jgi:hypothetical protein